jgi:hypothetical protein
MIFSQKLVGRYDELKQQVLDCILLMQVGTFMQVMNEDARAVSQVTGLKLRMAGEVDAPVVLGGFPKSGLDAYLGKLVRAGHERGVWCFVAFVPFRGLVFQGLRPTLKGAFSVMAKLRIAERRKTRRARRGQNH